MAWKGVHITEACRLSLRQAQLTVSREDGDIQIALEDVGWIIADSPQITISTALLAACAEAGVVVVITDQRHTPSMLALPFAQHHRGAAVAREQIAMSKPLKKRLWQRMIKQKILNQGAVLASQGHKTNPPLNLMAKRVASGDPDNLEAQAARLYWQALFQNFTRASESDFRNHALNYAYAVLRSIIARSLTASGLLPMLGVHHDSASNTFNLADDLIEAYRPVADSHVIRHFASRDRSDKMSREDRQKIAKLPVEPVLIGEEVYSVLYACEVSAQSLVRVIEQGDARQLLLPSISRTQLQLSGVIDAPVRG